MLPVSNEHVHHVIEEGKILEAVRVALCYESDRSCGNNVNADFGKSTLLSPVFDYSTIHCLLPATTVLLNMWIHYMVRKHG